ncbi:MAG: hypothetical protein V4662_07800 [Verrucomicrobiota bacterium]
MHAILTAIFCLLYTRAQACEAETVEAIRTAIQGQRMLAIFYEGQERRVEPHMLALNQTNSLASSAWFVSGYSKVWPRPWLAVISDFEGARSGRDSFRRFK